MRLGGEQQAAFEYTLKGSNLVNIVGYGGRGNQAKRCPPAMGERRPEGCSPGSYELAIFHLVSGLRLGPIDSGA